MADSGSDHSHDRSGEDESTVNPRHLKYSYTVILFVLAGLSLIAAFNHELLIRITANEVVTPILRFVQAIEAIIFVFALIVAVLRTYRSPLALPTTAAVSILLALWMPFGTAAFIYWVGWVRKYERQPAGAPES